MIVRYKSYGRRGYVPAPQGVRVHKRYVTDDTPKLLREEVYLTREGCEVGYFRCTLCNRKIQSTGKSRKTHLRGKLHAKNLEASKNGSTE